MPSAQLQGGVRCSVTIASAGQGPGSMNRAVLVSGWEGSALGPTSRKDWGAGSASRRVWAREVATQEFCLNTQGVHRPVPSCSFPSLGF